MATAFAIVGCLWLAALVRVHWEGLSIWELSWWWSMILAAPAIAIPVFSSGRTVRQSLLEPSAKLSAIVVAVIFGFLALALGALSLVSWQQALLVCAPSVQLLLIRAMFVGFNWRFGRFPAPITVPGILPTSILAFALEARDYRLADRLFAFLMFVLAIGPFVTLAFVFRDAT